MRSIFLFFAMLFVGVTQTYAQHNDWVIGFVDKGDMHGILLKSVSHDSLTIIHIRDTLQFPLSSVNFIKKPRSSSDEVRGTFIGFLLGGGVSYVLGTIINKEYHYPNSIFQEVIYNKAAITVAGAVLGGVLGNVLSNRPNETIYHFDILTDDMKAKILNEIIDQEQSKP